MPDSYTLIRESWVDFLNHVAVKATITQRKTISIRTVYSDATGQMQPADVGFFSCMKSLMKRFYSHVIEHDLPFYLRKKDNIQKVSVETSGN